MTIIFMSNSSEGAVMKRPVMLFLSILMLPPSYAETPRQWDGDYASTKTSYLMYSGSLSEKEPPRTGSQKLSLMIEGPLAKELFDSLGANQKQACGASTGVRIRQRGDVTCAYDHEIKSAPYTCFVGLDLKTGKSMPGETC